MSVTVTNHDFTANACDDRLEGLAIRHLRKNQPLSPIMTVSEALSAERERQGVSLYRLAQLAGTSPGRIKSILDGDTPNPGILTVRAILAGLGKSLAWLEKQTG